MPKVEFDRAVAAILEKDQRFAPEAYGLVRDALNHTLEHHSREHRGEKRRTSADRSCWTDFAHTS